MSVAPRPAVLLVGNFLSRNTGIRGVCEDLAKRLAPGGFRVFTTSSHKNSTVRGLGMVATTSRRLFIIDVAQIDLYSGRAFFWGEAVTAVLRVARKPHVITLHGGGLPEFSAARPRRFGRVLAGASAVTAPSSFLARELAPLRPDIHVIPNGLETRAYPFRERIEPQPRLVWLRAIHEIYDPVLAIEVVARLVPRYPEVSLAMIGPDKGDGSSAKVRSVIARLGLEGRVAVEGAVPKSEVPQRLNRADIFLNTSRVDNAPVTLIEAMACGLGVVTTDAGGIPDLVRHEHDALVAPVGDADALAENVRRLLEERELAGRLSCNGRETAAQHDWEKVLPKWVGLFSKAASGD